MKKQWLVFIVFVLLRGISFSQSVGGVTSGAATYCSTTNSGFLSLTGFVGSILNWELSTDGGATWTNIGNVTSTQSYVSLTVTTCYRAIVQNGAFPPDTSTVSCITIYAPSNGGTITGGGTFCASSGSGTLTISGNVGSILNWIVSTDGGSTWTTITDTNTFLNYSTITVNTMYAAIAQNATCPSDTSGFVTFTILPASAGGITSVDDTVCYSSNSGTITVSGMTGSVTNWIASTDGGVTWTSIPDTSSTLPYSGLLQTTEFAAIVQNGICSPDTSTSVLITVLTPPSVSAGADTTIAPGQSVTLNGSGSASPSWSPAGTLDTSTIFSPLATPLTTTTYTITVTDGNGCTNSDAVVITVIPPVFDGLIAGLFTPNGDGINDAWYIENITSYTDSEVMVFNIYGQEVYSQKNYQNDWKGTYNGKDLPDGTYYYVLRFEKDDQVFKGSLDILRNK